MGSVVRVVPDVTGIDKAFDYLAPAGAPVEVGAIVRVPLHGRRVTGWVVELEPPDQPLAPDRLRPVDAVVSRGPSPDLVALAGWASVRWAAGRLRPFLVAASPPGRVRSRPDARRGGADDRPLGPVGRHAASVLAAGGGLLVVPPAASPVEAIVAAARTGPTLVAVPAVGRAATMAAALRRRGLTVAQTPEQWPLAAAGVDVVIGARRAAWAPCPGLAAVVVIDEHDEALQEERAPTWHARDVLVERARRAGVPVLLTSPSPTVVGVAAVTRSPRRLPVADERAGWPIVEVVDRRAEEPWRTSLLTSPLIGHLRRPDAVVVCVHNTPGRGRILACRACRALVRCARCDAAVALADDATLVCPRCATARARVCQVCGAAAFANLRPGVTRLREEIEAAAGRPVVAVTGRDDEPPAAAGVYVGTEAVLHRVERADVVAFCDFDRELLAPRYRAAEQAMALLVRAARRLGPRSRGGRLLVQTFLPDHEVIRAALLADPGRLVASEAARRELLGLPPSRALASVSGPGADGLVAWLRSDGTVTVGGTAGEHLVRAAGWDALGAALLAAKRATGSPARIAVDPPRV